MKTQDTGEKHAENRQIKQAKIFKLHLFLFFFFFEIIMIINHSVEHGIMINCLIQESNKEYLPSQTKSN